MYKNTSTMIGYVGNVDPVRTMPNGRKVRNFSLGTSESWKDKNTGEYVKGETQWHRIAVFGNAAEIKSIQKGAHLLVEGKLVYSPSTYTDKDGVQVKTQNAQIVADTIRLMSVSKAPAETGEAPAPAPAADVPANAAPALDTLGDDIPF